MATTDEAFRRVVVGPQNPEAMSTCAQAVERFLSSTSAASDEDLRTILQCIRDEIPLPALERYPDRCTFVCEVATALLQRIKGRWYKLQMPKKTDDVLYDLRLICSIPQLRGTIGGMRIAETAETMIANSRRATR